MAKRNWVVLAGLATAGLMGSCGATRDYAASQGEGGGQSGAVGTNGEAGKRGRLSSSAGATGSETAGGEAAGGDTSPAGTGGNGGNAQAGGGVAGAGTAGGGGAYDGPITKFAPEDPEFTPTELALGPDGSVWFTEIHPRKVGRITPSGVITRFDPPSVGNTSLAGLTAGPDGNIWYTDPQSASRLGKVTPSGSITELLNDGSMCCPTGIAQGSDKNLWVIDATRFIRVTPAGVATAFDLTDGQAPGLFNITTGPDGNVWATDNTQSRIARVTPQGGVTVFQIPPPKAGVWHIVTGPDSALWFTERDSNEVGRISTAGSITEYPLPVGGEPFGIAADAKDLWVALAGAAKIARVSTAGSVLETFEMPHQVGTPINLVVDAKGAVWFTMESPGAIGKLVPP